jgi:endo-1,4-beta-D-glucanase Y
MRELAFQVEGFDKSLGWNDSNAFGLSNKCLMHMSYQDKKRFRIFYCAVDLKAWRKLKAETYQIPEPVELCNATRTAKRQSSAGTFITTLTSLIHTPTA